MIRRFLALLLAGTMLGLCSPVFAGDFVSPRFVVPLSPVAGLPSMTP